MIPIYLSQGDTDACSLVSASKAITNEVKYMLAIDITPMQVFNQLSQIFPIDAVSMELLAHAAVRLVINVPGLALFNISVRFINLGKPPTSDAELSALKEGVNSGLTSLIGLYEYKNFEAKCTARSNPDCT
eukprot:115735_1